jgi:hypothetical protein
MFMPPGKIWRKVEDSCNKPYNFVGATGSEKRAMSTIVKDYEVANQQTGGQENERQGEPVRYFQGLHHDIPDDHVGNVCIGNLP